MAKKKTTHRFSKGSKSKQEWIANKIRILEHENKGRSHEQNIAIAYSMYKQHHKEDGGEIENNYYQGGGIQLPAGLIQNEWGIITTPNPFVNNTGMFGTGYTGWRPQIGAQPQGSNYQPIIGMPPPNVFNTTQISSGARPAVQQRAVIGSPATSDTTTQIPKTATTVVTTTPATTVQPTNYYATNPPAFTTEFQDKQNLATYGDYKRGDNNLDGIVDAKDSIDKFGRNLNLNVQQPYQFPQLYSGVDLETSAYNLGQQIGEGDVAGSIVGGLNLLPKLGRNVLSGFGAGRVKQEGLNKYYQDQYRNISGASTPRTFKDGGSYNPMPHFEDGHCYECGGHYQEGGEAQQATIDNQPPAQQEAQMNPQEIISQVQQALAQGADVNQIAVQLSQMGLQEQEIQQIISAASQGQQAPQAQQAAPQQIDPNQIMSQVVEALQQGADPQQIVQQLQSMGIPPEQATQMVQQIIQQLQGAQQQAPAPQEQFAQGGQYLSALQGKTIRNYTFNAQTGEYDVEFD